MRLTLNLAGTVIAIDFLGQTKKVVSVYRKLFKGFISEERASISLEVRFLPDSVTPKLFAPQNNPLTLETQVLRPVSGREVIQWLSETGELPGLTSLTNETRCTAFLNGVLFYRPDASPSQIYILRDGLGHFRCLYFLLWLYFAQILGKIGGCFLHGAALVKDARGYILIGDSGSGKSTLSRLCKDYRVFSDDSPIISAQGRGYRVYPAPFHQEDSLVGIKDEDFFFGAPIERFCFLVKDKEMFLDKIPKKQAIAMILSRYIHFFQYLPGSSRLKLFDLFWGACDNILSYYLHFSMGQEVCSFLAQ